MGTAPSEQGPPIPVLTPKAPAGVGRRVVFIIVTTPNHAPRRRCAGGVSLIVKSCHERALASHYAIGGQKPRAR